MSASTKAERRKKANDDIYTPWHEGNFQAPKGNLGPPGTAFDVLYIPVISKKARCLLHHSMPCKGKLGSWVVSIPNLPSPS